MKVFRVVTERDGETTKVPGTQTTQRIREEIRFAADKIQQVWDATDWLRNDTDVEVIAIIEEAPAITVLVASEEVK